VGTLHYNADKIYGAGKAFNGEPLVHMKSAHQYVTHDVHLDWYALGAVGFPAVSTYNSSTEEMQGNLKGGVTTVEKIAESLSKVAQNYSSATKYSTIHAPASQKVPYTPVKETKPDFTATETFGIGGAIGGFAISMGSPALAPMWTAIRATLLADSAIEPLCASAIAVWLLFSPADSEVDKAIESWHQVERQLGAVQESVNNIIGNDLVAGNWANDDSSGDNSRRAFDEFMRNSFSFELNETKDRAKSTYTSLTDMKADLNEIQGIFFIYVMTCTATLIAAWIASFFPPIKPAAEALKKITATFLGLGSAGAIAAIATMADGNTTNISNLWIGTQNKFPGNRMNPDDAGTTNFSDVNKMDWKWDTGQIK
jgi:hypothetical protein